MFRRDAIETQESGVKKHGLLMKLDNFERPKAMNVSELLTSENCEASRDNVSRVLCEPPPSRVIIPETWEETNRAIWRCNPRYRSILKVPGSNIPYSTRVDFNALDINWRRSPDTPFRRVPCPHTDRFGCIGTGRVNYQSLIFGVGPDGVWCNRSFRIERPPGREVWVAVEETDWSRCDGYILVRVSWDT
jgi:hypothetical protein